MYFVKAAVISDILIKFAIIMLITGPNHDQKETK